MTNIAIIGGGNMGQALASGLIRQSQAKTICVSDPDEEKLRHLKDLGFHVTTHNQEATDIADVLIFAVKPQIFKSVAMPLKETIARKKPLLISVAAGIRTHSIEHWLGSQIALVRAMPNTPALIGCGATALYANIHVDQAARHTVESILKTVGLIVWLQNETQMDAVTALSGSGPAYFFFMMEALQQAAESLGLPAEIAKPLCLQTAFGAAQMAMQSDSPVSTLRENVTSRGGTTEQALLVFEENHLRDIFFKAMRAAKSRSEEMANSFGE